MVEPTEVKELSPAGAGSRVTKEAKPSKPVLRPWVRALHRDFGYFVVGLTVIYAVSGLAVNHIADFDQGDASFVRYSTSHELGPLTGDDDTLAKTVQTKLGITEKPKEVFRRGENELEITFENRTLEIDTRSGHVDDDGKKPRFFLRFANWLHLNRGKKAWTIIADGYAALLLFLAFSGLVMIPGKKGFFFRGLVLAGAGIAIPVVYVVFAGGK
jgi:hypothetical protein